ncbi:MAG TPA: tetratricopeptide repeat protein [Opitutaceae bacterium]|nr:tetratricopeptide repeat protein [Opitutaceae bacterium]
MPLPDDRTAADLYEQGRALRAAGDLGGAIAAYNAALERQPEFPEAANNLGNCLRSAWRLDEAEGAFRRALAARPEFPEAWSNLGATLKNLGRADEGLACLARAVALRPQDPALHSNLIFCRNYASSDDPAAMQAEERRWWERHGAPQAARIRPHANERTADRRIRVGYVSAGFREQAQSFFSLPLLEHHDHGRFEIVCYSDAAREDDVTERIRRTADRWVCIAGRGDDEVAEAIRLDQVDILVDLTVHAAQNRLPVFARKPAPVQVTWLGYPGSTGLPTVDYRFTDRWLDPPGEEAPYVETSVRLDAPFWCYDPSAGELPSTGESSEARRPEEITFGCLNNFSKTNDRLFALWRRILQGAAGSRLCLLAPPGSARRRALDALGVGEDRVEFVGFQPRARYLETYRRIDLCLDTFPCNGHTTSLDSWWMGVPVLSRRGRKVVGRAGHAFAHFLGLPEFSVDSDEAYVAAALAWAKEKARLAAARAGLRERMSCSPLMDGARFARAVEEAYRSMWRTCVGPKTAPAFSGFRALR